MTQMRRFPGPPDKLGESPRWNPDTGRIEWIDILGETESSSRPDGASERPRVANAQSATIPAALAANPPRRPSRVKSTDASRAARSRMSRVRSE